MILFLTGLYFSNWVEILKPVFFVGKGESGTNNLLDQQNNISKFATIACVVK